MSNPSNIDTFGIQVNSDDLLQNITLSMTTTKKGLTLNYDLTTTPKQFSISSNGINFNDGTNNYTTALERLALIQQAFSAIELPPNTSTLKVNNNIQVTNGTSTTDITQTSLGLQLGSNILLDATGIMTFNLLPECSAIPTVDDELVNKAYVDKFINTNFYFDDMFGLSGEGPLSFRTTGTQAAASPSQTSPSNDHAGIVRVFTPNSNDVAGWEMRASILFSNLLNNGKPLTIIFRPWPTGTTNNTTIKVGLSGTIGTSAPTNGLFWRYSTNIAPINNWVLVQDNVVVYTLPVSTQFVNTWIKITITKTSSNNWTSTFEDLTTNTIYSYSDSGISTSTPLFIGATVSCVSGAASKYIDIDYVQFETNNLH